MSDAEKTVTKNKHHERASSMHQWFWQDFTLLPPERLEPHEQTNRLAAKHSFWGDIAHTVQDFSRVAGVGAVNLHQWFWKDFVLSPRTQGAHRHDTHREDVQWCWEQCIVATHEPLKEGVD
jgi:hypothetical protein